METTPTSNSSRRSNLAYGYFVLAAAAILVFGVLAYGLVTAKPMSVSVVNPGSSGGLTITASATVHAAPDLALLSLGISNTAPTIKAARANMATAATRVIDALHAAGVADADIVTSGISLYQQNPIDYSKLTQVCPPLEQPAAGANSSSGAVAIPSVDAPDSAVTAVPPAPSVPAPSAALPTYPNCYSGNLAWTYSETLNVTVRDLDRTSEALDGAIAAGATNVNGISFDVSNRADFLSNAQAQAVAVAKAQATKLAQAAGATLGAPISLNTSYSGGNVYASDARAATGGTSTPISPGTLDITASVTVVYTLNS
jgi:uncharacterized protein YggE